jgi:hypothetical protein
MSDLSLAHPRAAAGRRPWPLEGLAAFVAIALGQGASMFGSQLTSFAMGVWVYQRTGSATALGLISFFTLLPEIALAPLGGALADRWNRRRAMLVGDLGSGLATAVLAGLALMDRLETGWVYPFVALASAFRAVQAPALAALTPLLVPRVHLARANAALELAAAAALMAGPVAAAGLLGSRGLGAILALDVLSFGMAVLSLLLVRVPSLTSPRGPRTSVLREAAEGWRHVRGQAGLLALLGLFAVVNFTNGAVEVLLPPLVLGFASAQALGAVMSAAGAGGLLGALLLAVLGGPRRAVSAILGLCALQGLVLLSAALRPSLPLVVVAGFAYSLTLPPLYAASQTLWQVRVPAELQGRAFAVRRVVAWSALPLAYLVSGRLADRVFEPLLADRGALAASVGRVIGSGPGRGTALLFITLGVTLLLATAFFARRRALRALDDEQRPHTTEEAA